MVENLDQTVFSAGKKKVSADQLEKELAKMWRDSAEIDQVERDKTSEETNARVRATLSNTIILIPTDSQVYGVKEVDSLITELCISHPARFFIVALGAQVQENSIQTAVSSRCVLARSGAHVCSEEIYISTTSSNISHVPNLLISLLRADVPTVLISLGGDDSDNGSFETLFLRVKSVCNTVIYDSSVFVRYDIGVRQVLSNNGPSNISFQDLNWKRTSRWRALISEQFDSDRLIKAIGSLSCVKLYCKSKAETLASGRIPSEMLLLASWIQDSLGWSCKQVKKDGAKGIVVLTCRNKQGTLVTIEFLPSDIQRVVFFMQLDQEKFSLVIENDFVNESASVWFDPIGEEVQKTDQKLIRKVHFPNYSTEALVLDAIVSDKYDKSFLTIVERSVEIAQLIMR